MHPRPNRILKTCNFGFRFFLPRFFIVSYLNDLKTLTMNSRHILLIVTVFFLSVNIAVHAQDDGSYKTPPKDITDMLLAKPTPNVSIDDKGEWMLFSEFSLYPSVEELAR